MEKMDWKKDCKALYFPPADPVLIDLPPLNCLMIDGHGDPNNNPQYQQAVEALFSIAYTLKFAIKKELEIDYAVFPAEGLWWAADLAVYTTGDKSAWDWTMLIAQPDLVTADRVERARADALKKKEADLAPTLRKVRFELFAEGKCAQMMHTGPYSAEGPNVARLHDFIAQQGYLRSGKHHEIYLSDVRRAAPEKLKTVLRQPVTPLP